VWNAFGIAGGKGSEEGKGGSSSVLGDTALELAKKLSSTQAMVVLLFLVAGLIVVQLAANPSPGAALWVVVVLFVVAGVAAFIVDRLDRPVTPKELSDEDIDAINDQLKIARDAVADRLKCDRARCRANVFGENSFGRLQMLRALRVNMDERVLEWSISIPPGRGGTGLVWETGRPNVLVAPFADEEDIEPADAVRVDPELKWIISAPVKVGQASKWIVNVDGKDERTRSQVEEAVPDVARLDTALKTYAQKL
jgi:hypothetical protein